MQQPVCQCTAQQVIEHYTGTAVKLLHHPDRTWFHDVQQPENGESADGIDNALDGRGEREAQLSDQHTGHFVDDNL